MGPGWFLHDNLTISNSDCKRILWPPSTLSNREYNMLSRVRLIFQREGSKLRPKPRGKWSGLCFRNITLAAGWRIDLHSRMETRSSNRSCSHQCKLRFRICSFTSIPLQAETESSSIMCEWFPAVCTFPILTSTVMDPYVIYDIYAIVFPVCLCFHLKIFFLNKKDILIIENSENRKIKCSWPSDSKLAKLAQYLQKNWVSDSLQRIKKVKFLLTLWVN